MSLKDIRNALEENDLALELEFIIDWFADGSRKLAADARAKQLFEVAETMEVAQVKVGGDQAGQAWPFDRMVSSFRALGENAANAGTRVVLEMMPWSNVADLPTATRLVEETAHPRAKLLLDVWHVARAGIAYEDVAKVPNGVIGYVEVCDALLEQAGTLIEDTVLNRRLCGEGQLRPDLFMHAVGKTGYQGDVGVEILSTQQRLRPVELAARLAHDLAMASLERFLV